MPLPMNWGMAKPRVVASKRCLVWRHSLQAWRLAPLAALESGWKSSIVNSARVAPIVDVAVFMVALRVRGAQHRAAPGPDLGDDV